MHPTGRSAHRKTALITGASSGIGYELTKLFAQDGYHLVLVARHRDRLLYVAGQLKETYDVSVTVLALGSCLLLLHVHFDPAFERYAEMAVGVTLIALGIWRLALLVQERRHAHPHAHHHTRHTHAHSHEPGREHVHRFAPTLVGMVHGASGTVELFVLIPITLISTPWLAYVYIGCFSVGCALTMSLYGYVVGRFYRRANQTGQRIYRGLVMLTSISGLVLGLVWIAKNL